MDKVYLKKRSLLIIPLSFYSTSFLFTNRLSAPVITPANATKSAMVMRVVGSDTGTVRAAAEISANSTLIYFSPRKKR